MAALRAPSTARQPRGTRASRRPQAITYPDSDGKPMGESDLHGEEMWRLIHLLHAYFLAQPEIYVTGNLILYYEEGNPRASISPDVMVVKDVHKRWRETYLLWQEGPAPCFVIEVTSKSTRAVDERKKHDLYERLGVQEYILYDPRTDAQVLSPEEQAEIVLRAAELRAAAESEARRIEADRARAAEARIADLERQLRERRPPVDP